MALKAEDVQLHAALNKEQKLQQCVLTGNSYLSLANSHSGSRGRSYSGIGSSGAELRRVVIRTRGVFEFMDELESADTYRKKDIG